MTTPLESSIVRVCREDGSIVGTGFLVGNRQVLTCAHVVASVLGLPDNTHQILEKPQDLVYLDFPGIVPGCLLTAHVILWQPPQQNGGGDIAGLELVNDPPEGTEVVRLVKAEDLWGHDFRTFGFPIRRDTGVWATGKLRGRQASGWVQIEDVKETGYRVQQGFSGGAVWDEQLSGVVGMVVAEEREPQIKAAFLIPTEVLVQAWPELGQQAIPPCPYRGLSAFREQDASFFFGRTAFTEELVETVRRKPFVAVIGSSGSGKSSVVFAGLIPHLRSEGGWLIVSFRPGDHPLRNLAAALIPLLEPEMSETDRLVEINKLTKWLQGENLLLPDVVERITQKHAATHLLLVADQFEELYTLCRETNEREYFLDRLLTAVQPTAGQYASNFTLLITLRADFFEHALSYRPFADALQHSDLKLGPMTRKELQDAIEKPAHKLHVKIEDGLIERILDEVGQEPGNLPLLEFALTLLWGRQRGGTLSHTAYNEIGGVEQALAVYAEEAYDRLSKEEQQRVHQVFVQLVRPGEGTEDTRRLATRAELGEACWSIVTRLSDARLVVSGRDEATGKEIVEIVHEALIKGWKRLDEWMEADREFRMWQERLRAMLRQWETNQRDEDALLRGALLVEAERWMQQRPDAISEAEKAFIQSSIARRWQQEAAERERQARELTLQRRAVHRLRYFVAALSFFSIVTIVLALVAEVGFLQAEAQRQVADREKQVALSHTLAAQANYYLLKNQPDLALLLSLKAYQTDNNYQTRDSLYTALEHSSYIVSFLLSGVVPLENGVIYPGSSWRTNLPLYDLAFSADSRTLASSDGRYGDVILWDIGTRKPQEKQLPCTGDFEVYSVAFSPDGQMLATAGPGGVCLSDTKTGAFLAQLEGEHTTTTTIAFSPDGKLLATGGCSRESTHFHCVQGQILLWDVGARKRVGLPLIGHTEQVSSITFSPDGKLLASKSCGSKSAYYTDTFNCTQGQILLWDMTAKKPTSHPLISFQGGADSIAFSPDGKLLASGGVNGLFTLWNVATGKPIDSPISSRIGQVRCFAFSPDGKRLASCSTDKTIRLWDVATGELIGEPLIGHQGDVTRVAFSSDGQHLASGDSLGALILWNVTADASMSRQLDGSSQSSNRVKTAVLSPDGKLLASGDADDGIVLWDVATGKRIGTLPAAASSSQSNNGFLSPESLAFSPDGRLLVSGSNESGSVILWDVATRKQVADFKDLWNIALSPDGHILAGSGKDRIITLWDVATRKVIKRLPPHIEEFTAIDFNSLAFSPDGQILAVVNSSTTITLWYVATGKLAGKFLYQDFNEFSGTERDLVTRMAFSRDGHALASTLLDGSVVLWNVTTGKGTRLFSIGGPAEYISPVAFSPNGKMLAFSIYRNDVILLDVASGERMVHPFHHLDEVTNVMFSPDGKLLISADLGGFINLWDINIASWPARACSIANRNFTPEEWKQFVNDAPYREVCTGLPIAGS